MKVDKRLKRKEALFLGKTPRPKTKYGNPKYSITIEQAELIEKKRSEDSDDFGKVDVGVKTGSDTVPNDYPESKSFVLSAWNNEGWMMDIDQYCKHYKLPRESITSYKLVSHTGTPYYNIVFKENKELEDTFDEKFIDKIVSKYVKKVKVPKFIREVEGNYFDRAIFTDVHIGMETNRNGHSLYGGKWDAEEQEVRINYFCNKVINSCKSKTLYVDDLGDFLDGWNVETARGGHKLPQNMDNETAFEVGLHLKVLMVDRLVNFYEKIVFNNVCNDNHSASFGYILNYSFKKIVEKRYKHVEVNNYRKFIDHYIIGDHCFIITHGKDSTNLKFGFKPILDNKQMEKIEGYIKSNDLFQKAKYIHFGKGDSHQAVYDDTTSQYYDYNSYPAMSPSSEWVQTNFKKGRSGFVIEKYDPLSNDYTRDKFWYKWVD